VTWPRKPTAGGAGRKNLSETNEVAWRLGRYQWLPNCSEERRRWVGQEHDIMFFRIDIGFRPITCYEVDGVEVYNPLNKPVSTWYIAVKRLIRVVTYNERFVVRVVKREPVPWLRIESVELLSPSVGYVGITAPFDPSVVKRIINFAERINGMPGYVADLVTADKDGYTLHITKHEKSGKRIIEHSLVLYFDSEGRLRMNDVTNKYVLTRLDLPITLFMGDEE
jgi:hypothetical protein